MGGAFYTCELFKILKKIANLITNKVSKLKKYLQVLKLKELSLHP